MTRVAANKPTNAQPFFDDAQAVVYGMRRALADLLASVNADPRAPQEVSRRFGLDKTLAWKVARVIREPDPWDAVGHIPRRPSIQILVNAMAKHGAPPDRVDALWSALEAFEAFVATHSDDRETLEIMVGAAARRPVGKRIEAYRKSAYQANSAIWGVRAKLQISMAVLAPGDTAGMLNMLNVAGFHEFLRLRPDVPWAVSTMSAWNGHGNTRPGPARSLETDSDAIVQAPILEEFCSQPLPALRSVTLPDDRVRFELAEGPVGNTAAATMLLAYVRRDTVSMYQSSDGEVGEHGVFLTTPVETAVHDLLIHRSLAFAMNPTAQLYSELPGGPRYLVERGNAGRIPIHEQVVDLGGGPPDLTTPEFPRYAELASRCVGKLGYSIEDFHAFRLRLSHPPIPSLSILKHPLLDPEKR